MRPCNKYDNQRGGWSGWWGGVADDRLCYVQSGCKPDVVFVGRWPVFRPRCGGLRPQKLKTHLLRTQSSKVLPIKPSSEYSHACFTYCQGFLPWTNFYPPGPFICIFPKNLFRVFAVLAMTNIGSCVGPQNKISHPACHSRWLMQVFVLSSRGIWNSLQNICPIVFPGWHFEIVNMGLTFRGRLVCSVKYEVCRVVLVSSWNILTEFNKKALVWFADL